MYKYLSNNTIQKLSNCIRVLSADSIEKASSGHPGMPLGIADVFTVLVTEFLKFYPSDPRWIDRDRLILSAGHGSMLLYSFYYLAGYKNYDIDNLKNFRQLSSITPGHPEYDGKSPIEITTGPLAQGIASSVGFALAEKKYKALYSTKFSNHKVYCVVGDGCLMEGLSYEAISYAGHHKLNNLVVIYDANKITIDGPIDIALSEDQIGKFRACGWDVYEVDGHDISQIRQGFISAQNSIKPFLLICNTIIGYGTKSKSNSPEVHGAPIGKEEIIYLKNLLHMPLGDFEIPEELLLIWRNIYRRNEEEYNLWYSCNQRSENISVSQILPFALEKNYHMDIVDLKEAYSTRQASGKVIEFLSKHVKHAFFGSSDLSSSNYILNNYSTVFNEYNNNGNFLYFGVREHLMGCILSALSIEGFLSIGGTFLVFSDYMRPAIRLAALMKIRVIYVMTHDSIGVGEDGPTHQPIEHLSSFRAMPNLHVMRPADNIETLECWEVALSQTTTPVLLALSRQRLDSQIRFQRLHKNLSFFGAYVLEQDNVEDCWDIGIFATGTEVILAKKIKSLLVCQNYTVRIISIPCFEVFWQQEEKYKDDILSPYKLRVGIEAATAFGWDQILSKQDLFFGIDDFGKSAPAEILYKFFGLSVEKMYQTILTRIKEKKILDK